MRNSFLSVMVVLSFPVSAFAQTQQPQQLLVDSPAQLIGKKINVKRLPLCEPSTYKGDLQHAGMIATVVGTAPSVYPIPPLSKSALDHLSPALRETLLDQQKALLLIVQFDDGTKRDTCAAISPKNLANYIELAPGETLGASPASSATLAIPGAASATSAAVAELSDEDVKAALQGKGGNDWVAILDGDLGAYSGAQVPEITLYLPQAILAMQNASAKRQYLSYEPTEEDRQNALTVFAQGFVASKVLDGCQSITRVVLVSDPPGSVVKEAYITEPLSATWRNVFGVSNSCQALRAKFSMSDVQQVQSAAHDGEFYVAVFAGSERTKLYKIKRKHQEKLGLR